MRKPWMYPSFVAAIALAIALFVFALVRESEREGARGRFHAVVSRIEDTISQQLDECEEILRGCAGLFAASKSVERDEWRSYLHRSGYDRVDAGAFGVAFVAFVAYARDERIEEFLRITREDGAPDFGIRERAVSEFSCPVVFIEPDHVNRSALGFDVWSTLPRREGLRNSCDSGKPWLTTGISLVQDGESRETNAVIDYPIYRNGASTETMEQKRQALQGWASFSFQPALLFAKSLEAVAPGMEIHLAEETPGFEGILFDTLGSSGNESPSFSEERVIERFGHRLRLAARAAPSLVAANGMGREWVVLLAGLVATGLLTVLAFSLVRTREKAVELAVTMTQSLSESERRFRGLAQLSTVGIFETDAQGRCVYVNPRWSELTGLSFEEAKGDGWAQAIHPEDRDKIFDIWSQSALRSSPFLAEFRFLRKDGTVVVVASHAVPMTDVGGQIRGYVGTDVDITEIRRAQMETEQFFDLSADLLCIAGFDGYFKKVNGAFVRILGWSREDLLSKPYMEFVHPDDRRATQTQRDSVAEGKNIESLVNRYLCFDGSWKWLQWSAIPIPERGLIFAAARDVTREREIQESLTKAKESAEDAAKSKAQFLANMSHEIRTPLNGVIGLAHILSETPLNPEQKEHVETLCRAGESLLAVVNDILDFSKIESGKLVLESVPFSPERVARDVVALMGASAKGKGLDLQLFLEPGIPEAVVGDPSRLTQIVSNLVGNALKFTKEGFVRIGVKRLPMSSSATVLRFEISDSGIGISPETRGNLFVEFSQADSSTTRKFGGTGLGLAICKKLVTFMGGEIGVESEPGKGSTFWIAVPFRRAEAAESISLKPTASKIESQSLPRGTRVLLVEDNPINQLVTKKLLENMGCRVVIAENGREGLVLAGSQPFSVVLMDCQMPEMDGYEATRLIRKIPGAASKLPIIALTASVGPSKESCFQAGMNAFLSKPVSGEELRNALIQWIPQEPAVEPEAAQAPALDPEAFGKLLDLAAGVGPEFLIELIETFERDAAKQLQVIREAIRAGNADSLYRTAHSFKGASANMGAKELSRLCREVEMAGREGAVEKAKQVLPALEGQWERTLAELGERKAQR